MDTTQRIFVSLSEQSIHAKVNPYVKDLGLDPVENSEGIFINKTHHKNASKQHLPSCFHLPLKYTNLCYISHAHGSPTPAQCSCAFCNGISVTVNQNLYVCHFSVNIHVYVYILLIHVYIFLLIHAYVYILLMAGSAAAGSEFRAVLFSGVFIGQVPQNRASAR